MLFIVSHPSQLETYLSLLQAGDEVILIDSAVNLSANDVPSELLIHRLGIDINYEGFIALTEKHRTIL